MKIGQKEIEIYRQVVKAMKDSNQKNLEIIGILEEEGRLDFRRSGTYV